MWIVLSINCIVIPLYLYPYIYTHLPHTHIPVYPLTSYPYTHLPHTHILSYPHTHILTYPHTHIPTYPHTHIPTYLYCHNTVVLLDIYPYINIESELTWRGDPEIVPQRCTDAMASMRPIRIPEKTCFSAMPCRKNLEIAKKSIA